jgi:hypothetical protein
VVTHVGVWHEAARQTRQPLSASDREAHHICSFRFSLTADFLDIPVVKERVSKLLPEIVGSKHYQAFGLRRSLKELPRRPLLDRVAQPDELSYPLIDFTSRVPSRSSMAAVVIAHTTVISSLIIVKFTTIRLKS